jgi:hypothetical protein
MFKKPPIIKSRGGLMNMFRLSAGLLLLSITSGCSLLETSREKSSHYVFEVVDQKKNRDIASDQFTEKTILVKKCQDRSESCTFIERSLKYDEFASQLQKRIEVKSYVSQQISLLEQQGASLRLDREALQNEIDLIDRRLKEKSMSQNVTHNIRDMRASILLEMQELDQKIQLTEKDLFLLKSPLKNRTGVNQDTARLLEIIESGAEFGSSLQYRDNLIAQVLDSVAQELM